MRSAEPCFVEAAGHDDVEALTSVERRCYTHPWTPRGFREALRRGEQGRVLVARGFEGGLERGIQAYCVVEMVVDEVHVHNLAVRPESRGSGLARVLLRLALGLAEKRGARVAILEVRESNRPAIELYRSMGFVPVASRRNYYSQPTEDALVLRKEGLARAGDQP